MQRKWKQRRQRLAKTLLPSITAGMLLLSAYNPAWANPAGGAVVSGSATIQTSGSTMTVNQSSHKAILNWQSFSIGKGETVQFVQPGTGSVALNRVLGNNASAIYGTLTANGKVFLVNPSGVLFAPGAQVSVGGLVASTLSITDSNFLNGIYSFSGTGGSVINKGSVNAAGEAVFLGSQAVNEGVIAAKVVGLAAGSKVSLDFTGDTLLNLSVDTGAAGSSVTNSGTITAPGGLVLMTTGTKEALLSTVVNNTGVIRAQTVDTAGGVIRLLGGTVNVGGILDASAPSGGDGGFIETSGAKVKILAGAKVTTLAASGKTGDWLLDPNDFTIAATGGDMTAAQVADALAGSNFEIRTSDMGTPSGNGDIFVNQAVMWNTPHILTLTAERNININANITATSASAGLTLNSGSGGYSLANGAKITLSGNNASFRLNGTPYTVINDHSGGGALAALQAMNGNLAGRYFLGVDIDAGATAVWNPNGSDDYYGYYGFAPVGNSTTKFTGSFDGGGHTISRLYINRPATDHVGLFGYAGSGSAIRNTGLTGGSITGHNYVGGLIGYNGSDGSITNSCNSGMVNGNSRVGGLIGHNGGNGSITNSYNSGAVNGLSDYVGGLVGYNDGDGSITNSYNSGAVKGLSDFVGGLVGYNDGEYNHGHGSITNSYNTGAVNSNSSSVGGLVGYNCFTSITNSYNTGTVNGNSTVGGLVGYNIRTNITNSYNAGMVTSLRGSAGGLAGANHGGYIGDDGNNITNSYNAGIVTGWGGVGGLVGEIGSDIKITNSYNTGTVNGKGSVGGLAGVNNGSITSSYSTGAVNTPSAQSDVGGLVGWNNFGSIAGSYWDVDASGRTAGVGRGSTLGVTGLTTADMMKLSSFSAWGDAISATGGGSAVWRIYDGQSRPLLRSFLTPLTVTANNVTRTYDGTTGGNNSGVTFSTTPSGLLLGATAYAGSSQGARNAGTYDITPTGFYSTSQHGYDISYASGTLTITRKTMTLTAPNASKTYDGVIAYIATAAYLTYLNALSGALVGGDTVTNATIGGLGSGLVNQSSGNVGSLYTITGAGINLGGLEQDGQNQQ